ncbi:glutamine--fructose-6-phosphate transaminase (isomerizing) [Segatella bryantii]|uniref:glutamine--fructose-6-phosphate transaminase (isomerizing) n=1 Tax=Segatella bryantii TaxID=77095 RepID=UPI002853562F|nr:glutamine--fructose-6-phosphate transaminase (isomerizing) [Segatella bryantii]MDR4931310.1 glutamine--fructose-6-phosphate transaminase (isomerizing) [Segatella bryantii]
MCGIVGYIGTKQAYPILIKGLHRLEYRGYDSAGVAMVHNDSLNVYKAKGKVSELEHVAANKDVEGSIGIAHTRWATHGQPNATNAHPHVSMSGDLALVHNGIIENYIELKQQLIDKGYEFKSETDTEVLVQLIDYSYRQTENLLDAVCAALNKVIGAYAIAVIDKNHPDTLIAARKSSPLVVGVGENNSEFFVGSDASPIVEYTDKVIYLDDEQIACIHSGEDIKIIDLNNHSVDFDIKKVDLDISQLTKGGFPHFMLKEIYDQPECIRNCIRGRLIVDKEHPENNKIKLSALNNFKSQLIRARHVIIVACGTSWHAGLIGKQLIEKMCRIRVEVEYASEFRYREPVIDKDDVIIAISQSGETADTLAAIQLAKENGALVFGIVNGVGSSIARESDTGIYIHVGPEIGVASTKAFTGQVVVLSMLSIALGHALGTVTDKEYSEYIAELATIPEKIQKVLEQNDKIDKLSNRYTYAKNFLYLGRGFNYPVALEGALKLKEISYIHAEGYPAAEMKHGPIALVDEDMPIVFIATHHQLYQKIISNMKEVKARNGRILAVVTEGDQDVKEIADEIIEIPETIAPFAPLLSVIPLQLLSYHVAVKKGLNVDMPRNLAKSVTVE